jgi:hypothetical protein
MDLLNKTGTVFCKWSVDYNFFRLLAYFFCHKWLYSVLRIRDFYPGSRIRLFSIPDPRSRIRIKEFKYFNPKKCFLSSRKDDPGCSSRTRIPDPDPGSGTRIMIPDSDSDFLPIPDPGSRGQKGT